MLLPPLFSVSYAVTNAGYQSLYCIVNISAISFSRHAAFITSILSGFHFGIGQILPATLSLLITIS